MSCARLLPDTFRGVGQAGCPRRVAEVGSDRGRQSRMFGEGRCCPRWQRSRTYREQVVGFASAGSAKADQRKRLLVEGHAEEVPLLAVEREHL